MDSKKKTSKTSTNKADRRRGRPTGKNRVPLSLEERRARNAQYERERRNENAKAMTQLAEAAGCDQNISNAELIATVISRLQSREKRPQKHSLEDLKRINDNLESQIALLEKRLQDDPNFISEDLNKSDSDSSSSESDSNSDSDTSDIKRPAKCRKTSTRTTVHAKSKRNRINSMSSTHSRDSVWSSKQSDSQEQDSLQPSSNRSSVMYSPESIAQEPQEYEPDLNMEFQFVSGQQFLATRAQHQSETGYAESFDETEETILNCLSSDEFINFNTDASNLDIDWPLADLNEFLTTY